MLPKHCRLSRKEIEDLKKKNKNILQGEFFGLILQKVTTPGSKQKFGVIISNNVCKKAVVRNKIKRLLFLAIQTFPFPVSGRYLFLAKKSALKIDKENIYKEIIKLRELIK